MSKLDEITIDFGYAVGDLRDAPEAKEQIKSLMLEIIGEDENDPNSNTRWQAYRNEFRAELREKVEKL